MAPRPSTISAGPAPVLNVSAVEGPPNAVSLLVRAKVLAPEPPTRVSLPVVLPASALVPDPPQISAWLPAPPARVALPVPATRMLLVPPPVRTSAPAPP